MACSLHDGGKTIGDRHLLGSPGDCWLRHQDHGPRAHNRGCTEARLGRKRFNGACVDKRSSLKSRLVQCRRHAPRHQENWPVSEQRVARRSKSTAMGEDGWAHSWTTSPGKVWHSRSKLQQDLMNIVDSQQLTRLQPTQRPNGVQRVASSKRLRPELRVL